VIEQKRKIIKRLYQEGIPSRILYIGLDLNEIDRFQDAMREIDRDKETLFVAEGLTPYLNPEAMKTITEYIGTTKSGNRFYFDAVLECLVDQTCFGLDTAQRLSKVLVQKGEPVNFGLKNTTESVAQYLKPANLKLSDLFDIPKIQQRFQEPDPPMEGMLMIESIVG